MDTKDRLSRYEAVAGAANTTLTLFVLALSTIGFAGINFNYTKYSRAKSKVIEAINEENKKIIFALDVVRKTNYTAMNTNAKPGSKERLSKAAAGDREALRSAALEAKQAAEVQRSEYVQFELQGLKLPISLQQAAIVWSALFTLLCFFVYTKKRQAFVLLTAYISEAKATPPNMVEPVMKSPFWLAPLPWNCSSQVRVNELSAALGWSGQEVPRACLAGLAAASLWALHVYVIGIGILVNDEVGQGLGDTSQWQAIASALAPAVFAGLSAALTIRWFFMSGVPDTNSTASSSALSRRRLLMDGAAFSGTVAAVGLAYWSHYRNLISRGVNVRAVLRVTGNCMPWFRKRTPKSRVVTNLNAGFYLNEGSRHPDRNKGVHGLHYVRSDGRVMRLNPGASPRYLKPVNMMELEQIVSIYGVPKEWKTSNAEVAAINALKNGDVDAALRLLRIGIMIDLQRQANRGLIQANSGDASIRDRARIESAEMAEYGIISNGAPDDVTENVKRIVKAVLAQVMGSDASPRLLQAVLPPRRCLPPDPSRREFILTLGPNPQRDAAIGGTSVTVSLKPQPTAARYPISRKRTTSGASSHNYRLYDLLAGVAVRFGRQKALNELIVEIGKANVHDRRLLDRIEKWQAPKSPWHTKWTDKRLLPLRRAGAPRGSKAPEDIIRI